MTTLHAYITEEGFKASPFAKMRRKRGLVVKLDAKDQRVLINDNGRCSVEQFGALPLAVAKYKEVIEVCMK